jgi:dephospho-CoA kinase
VAGKLKLVGLTGGIGSGKSTVGRMVQALGVPVIDADRLAREVVAPGQPAHAEVAARWPETIAADGQIDRKRLGALVFSDPAARAQLEAITHPRIQERLQREAEALERAGHRLAFYEASLLVEVGRHRDFDALVVVTADEAQQVARTVARDGSSPQQAMARVRAQLPLEEKRKVATHLIDNSGDLEATRRQTEALVRALSAGALPPTAIPPTV